MSSILLLGESILKKMIGLVSTLILARVLLPEDFGIVAIAILIIGLIEILSNTGSLQYLLRVDEIDEEKVNTAFTIDVIFKGSIATLIAALSFLIADYYDDPRLINVILSLTCVFMLSGLRNPGEVFLRREQNYTKLIKISLVAKVISVIVAIFSALTLQNYWALIFGQATNAVLMLVGSYFVHPHRPKLTLKNAREQWQFSSWIIPQSIFGYIRTQLDTFIVSSTFGKAELGSYHTMKYIAFMPSSHIVLPIIQPFLVELRKTMHNPNEFAKQFNTSFIITMLIALPITCTMYFHHEIVTLVLLGKNWLEYSVLLGTFSLLVPAFVMLNQCLRVLIVYGKTKHIFMYECVAFVILYSSLFAVGIEDLLLFTSVRVGIENIMCFVFLILITVKYTSIKNTLSLLASIIPFLLGAVLAAISSSYFVTLTNYSFLKLLIATMFTFLTFYGTVFVFHLIFRHRFQEWKYLETLLLRTIEPIKKRLQR
ncbi:oligosaccharide flippase family protein [Brumicola pallidula]|uniref:oligosaccharide flippase family protein n=1 Tax=Brumicola pallidula TaxID=56807 RepID=UPI001FD5168B|nr:oligosaccharide flippase family protein [Glaciecola pallidula]